MLSYMPLQASAHAAEIDQMTVLVHWLMLVMFVGWGLFFLFVLFRFRKAANPKASYRARKARFRKAPRSPSQSSKSSCSCSTRFPRGPSG